MAAKISRHVVTVESSASLASAVETMLVEGIHHLVVADKDKLLGVLSDRDVLDAWSRGAGITMEKLTVSDAFRKDLPRISSDTSLQEAIAIMQREYSDALLVELENNAIGIITTTDLLRSLTGRKEPSGLDFAKLTFADPFLQKFMKTLSDIGI